MPFHSVDVRREGVVMLSLSFISTNLDEVVFDFPVYFTYQLVEFAIATGGFSQRYINIQELKMSSGSQACIIYKF